ncbi:MAG: hypothetical protein EP343_23485 [Deltaproteobacteria bacterium]|nr:MAG: hypothetical protein EP343_23485 [Deltaproteobacteria bacterium]
MKKMLLFASNAACLVMLFVIAVLAPLLFLPTTMLPRLAVAAVALFGLLHLFFNTKLGSIDTLQRSPWLTIIMVPVLLVLGFRGTRLLPLMVGIPVLIFLMVLGIQWLFFNARDNWQEFAQAHGLEVTGLGVEEFPKMTGRWRGVPIQVELMYDPSKLGASEENVSLTVVQALWEPPTPSPFSITAQLGSGSSNFVVDSSSYEVVDVVQQSAALSQALTTFFATYPRSGEIDESGVTTADFSLLPPDKIEVMLNQCVDTLMLLRQHVEGQA